MKYVPIVALLFGAMLGVLLLAPLPFHTRAADAFGDLVHAPAFGVLAALVLLACYRLGLRGTWVAVAVWAALIALGGLMEIVQKSFGRGPSWNDFWADALGVTAAVVLVAQPTKSDETAAASWLPSRRRWLLAVALLLAAQLPPSILLFDCFQQWWEMPQIASFERPLEMTRWRGFDCRLRRVERSATHGRWALEFEYLPGIFPGVELQHPPSNWTGHDELLFDVWLDDGPPLATVLKIHDRQHWYNGLDPSDRFERRLELHPGWQQIRVKLEDVASSPHDRRMNLREISFLQLFTSHLQQNRTLVLDNMQLR